MRAYAERCVKIRVCTFKYLRRMSMNDRQHWLNYNRPTISNIFHFSTDLSNTQQHIVTRAHLCRPEGLLRARFFADHHSQERQQSTLDSMPCHQSTPSRLLFPQLRSA